MEEPVTWTYFPDEGTFNNGTYAWSFDSDAEPRRSSSLSGEVKPFTVIYYEAGEKKDTKVRITYNNEKVDISCEIVTVSTTKYVAGPEESSSSEDDDTPDNPSSSSSSSSRNGDIPDIGY
jgi:hypothetical protein